MISDGVRQALLEADIDALEGRGSSEVARLVREDPAVRALAHRITGSCARPMRDWRRSVRLPPAGGQCHRGFGRPFAVRAIVTELRKLFRFQGYRLLSTSMLHAVANPG